MTELVSRDHILGANDGQDKSIEPLATIHSIDIINLINSALWYTEGLTGVKIDGANLIFERKDGTGEFIALPRYIHSVSYHESTHELIFSDIDQLEIFKFKVPSWADFENLSNKVTENSNNIQINKDNINKNEQSIEDNKTHLIQHDKEISELDNRVEYIEQNGGGNGTPPPEKPVEVSYEKFYNEHGKNISTGMITRIGDFVQIVLSFNIPAYNPDGNAVLYSSSEEFPFPDVDTEMDELKIPMVDANEKGVVNFSISQRDKSLMATNIDVKPRDNFAINITPPINKTITYTYKAKKS